MSMTRNEASEILSDKEITCLIGKFHGAKEALDVAIFALRPVSREQVEKVWKGCEYCCGDVDDRAYIDSQAFYISGEGYLVNGDEDEDICQLLFCPKCGSPLTDEAVVMVMGRMEAVYGQASD